MVNIVYEKGSLCIHPCSCLQLLMLVILEACGWKLQGGLLVKSRSQPSNQGRASSVCSYRYIEHGIQNNTFGLLIEIYRKTDEIERILVKITKTINHHCCPWSLRLKTLQHKFYDSLPSVSIFQTKNTVISPNLIKKCLNNRGRPILFVFSGIPVLSSETMGVYGEDSHDVLRCFDQAHVSDGTHKATLIQLPLGKFRLRDIPIREGNAADPLDSDRVKELLTERVSQTTWCKSCERTAALQESHSRLFSSLGTSIYQQGDNVL